jgi:hypothetical protein
MNEQQRAGVRDKPGTEFEEGLIRVAQYGAGVFLLGVTITVFMVILDIGLYAVGVTPAWQLLEWSESGFGQETGSIYYETADHQIRLAAFIAPRGNSLLGGIWLEHVLAVAARDAERQHFDHLTVSLDSRGGNTARALEIVKAFQAFTEAKKIKIYGEIAAGSVCASSCALIFGYLDRRFIDPAGLIAFHGGSVTRQGHTVRLGDQESIKAKMLKSAEHGSASFSAYARCYGLFDDPAEIYWFSGDEIGSMFPDFAEKKPIPAIWGRMTQSDTAKAYLPARRALPKPLEAGVCPKSIKTRLDTGQ